MNKLEESMKSTELMFAGSLVATSQRPDGMLKGLRIPVFEDDLGDPQAKAIFRAVQLAHDSKFDLVPTADNLARIMIQEGVVPVDGMSVEDLVARQKEIAAQISEIAELGGDSPNYVNALAAAIQEHTNTKRLMAYGDIAKKVTGDTSMVSEDQYQALANELESRRPNATEPRIYTVKDQRDIMRKLVAQQKALLGKILMTLPIAWGIGEHVPYLLKGLMYIVTGLTGRGKSAMLQQLGDHLADSGFTVLYFHAEDAIDRQMMRQAVRLAGASMKELVAGDPRKKYEQVDRRLRERDRRGGSVTYVHCLNQPVSFIRMVTMQLKPDVIIVDYLQKLNRAPQMKQAGGKDDLALAIATDELKQLAENDKQMVAVIVGSQEVEHEGASDRRKGTFGSRQIEHKAQVVIELDVPLLTEEDGPEEVDGVVIAKPGELSGFGYMTVRKNNDGSQGFAPGVFNRNKLTFKSIDYITWERNNPDADHPGAILQEPDEKFYASFQAKTNAWDKIDLVLKDPRTRRRDLKKAKREGGPAAASGRPVEPDEPF